VRGVEGGGGRKLLKVLTVEVKVIFSVFWCRLGLFSIKFRLQINRERSERGKNEKIERFGHKKIIGPRPLGGARAGCAPPWIR